VGTLGFELIPARQAVVESLMSGSSDEPLGREIWHQAVRADDARVRLILAVTAVEVEIKRTIGDLAPVAGWLATEAPAPPIVKMLKNYLPRLRNVQDKFAPPPKRLLSVIGAAVEVRNKLVHVGSPAADVNTQLKTTTVDEVVECSSDLLWLLDIYRGHAWAEEHLSDTLRTELAGQSG